jgi:hypothetical protein
MHPSPKTVHSQVKDHAAMLDKFTAMHRFNQKTMQPPVHITGRQLAKMQPTAKCTSR